MTRKHLWLRLPNCGEDGVMIVQEAKRNGARVEVRGVPYSERKGTSDGQLWDLFDRLYPSKTSALMGGDSTHVTDGQGDYSRGHAELLKLFEE